MKIENLNKEYLFEDIVSINVFQNKQYTNGLIHISLLLDYFFVRVKFNNGDKYDITCFVIEDLDSFLCNFKDEKILYYSSGPMFLDRNS